jgi:hypothetical protein
MNTKLTHIIEGLREQYIKRRFEEPEPYKKFFKEYGRNNHPDDEDICQ